MLNKIVALNTQYSDKGLSYSELHQIFQDRFQEVKATQRLKELVDFYDEVPHIFGQTSLSKIARGIVICSKRQLIEIEISMLTQFYSQQLKDLGVDPCDKLKTKH